MKQVLIFILSLFSLFSYSQYSMYYGDSEFLELPDIPNGYVTSAIYNCDKEGIKFTSRSEVGCVIEITHYFSGTATISCSYVYTYLGTYDNNYHPGSGSKHWYITFVGTKAVISESSLEMTVGKTYTLSYTLESSKYGKPAAQWSSSDEYVATVSSSGKVTATGAGTALITCDPIVGPPVFCNVKVQYIAPISLDVTPKSLSLLIGKTETIKYTLAPTGASARMTYVSSNKNIATVSSTGKVTAVAEGSAKITVKTDNGLQAEIPIEVVGMPTAISVPSSLTVELGYWEQIPVAYTPSAAVCKTTYSSADRSIVQTSSSGRIHAVSVGTTTITVKTENNLTGQCVINVVKRRPTSLGYRPINQRINIIKELYNRTKK